MHFQEVIAGSLSDPVIVLGLNPQMNMPETSAEAIDFLFEHFKSCDNSFLHKSKVSRTSVKNMYFNQLSGAQAP